MNHIQKLLSNPTINHYLKLLTTTTTKSTTTTTTTSILITTCIGILSLTTVLLYTRKKTLFTPYNNHSPAALQQQQQQPPPILHVSPESIEFDPTSQQQVVTIVGTNLLLDTSLAIKIKSNAKDKHRYSVSPAETIIEPGSKCTIHITANNSNNNQTSDQTTTTTIWDKFLIIAIPITREETNMLREALEQSNKSVKMEIFKSFWNSKDNSPKMQVYLSSKFKTKSPTMTTTTTITSSVLPDSKLNLQENQIATLLISPSNFLHFIPTKDNTTTTTTYSGNKPNETTLSSKFTVTNTTANNLPVAFKVMTTDLTRFAVRPNEILLEGNESVEVDVICYKDRGTLPIESAKFKLVTVIVSTEIKEQINNEKKNNNMNQMKTMFQHIWAQAKEQGRMNSYKLGVSVE
jgi:hypothetical protein